MALKLKFYLEVSFESERATMQKLYFPETFISSPKRQNGFQSTEVLTSFDEKKPAQSFKTKMFYKLELTQNLMHKTKKFFWKQAILILLRNRQRFFS